MISYIINKKRGSKMRNIHYKGIHEDRWVFGDLIHKDGMLFIGIVGSEIFQVADETVSEFTGVLDFTPWSDVPMAEKEDLVTNYNRTSPIKETVISFEKIWHGVPIYENDIVECQHLFDETRIFRGAIKFYNGCFGQNIYAVFPYFHIKHLFIKGCDVFFLHVFIFNTHESGRIIYNSVLYKICR